MIRIFAALALLIAPMGLSGSANARDRGISAAEARAIARAEVRRSQETRQRRGQVFESPFQNGPRSQPVRPGGYGTMVVPNR